MKSSVNIKPHSGFFFNNFTKINNSKLKIAIMAILTSCWCIDIAILFIGFIIAIYDFYRKKHKHWDKYNIPHTTPKIPFGDIGITIAKENIVFSLDRIYKTFEKEKVVGIWSFFQPFLIVKDVELIKDILVKDFMSFTDRSLPIDEENDPLSANLLSLKGSKWKSMRAKLSPTFTSGKMKMMFPILVQCGNDMLTVLQPHANNNEIVDMRDILARLTTDIIASCAFGIDSNSLKNPDAEFRKQGKKFSEPSLKNLFRGLLILSPKLAKLFKIRFFPKDMADFFTTLVRETIEFREKNNVKRNDFMQLLIQFKNKGKLDDADEVKGAETEDNKTDKKFTLEEATSQALLFFIAGFDTSSTTMTFALYELALHPEIQEKLRDEIKRDLAKNNGEITYETIFGMEYLGNVIDETLRKYPVTGLIFRECTREYRIQDSDMVIPKGTALQIPLYSLHHDPKFYPDPHRFDPDRFKEEIRAQRHRFAYLPFGEGPRNCIGMRFGLMQIRVGLVHLLLNYKFEICEKSQVPMVFNNTTFSPKEGVNLRISKLN